MSFLNAIVTRSWRKFEIVAFYSPPQDEGAPSRLVGNHEVFIDEEGAAWCSGDVSAVLDKLQRCYPRYRFMARLAEQ